MNRNCKVYTTTHPCANNFHLKNPSLCSKDDTMQSDQVMSLYLATSLNKIITSIITWVCLRSLEQMKTIPLKLCSYWTQPEKTNKYIKQKEDKVSFCSGQGFLLLFFLMQLILVLFKGGRMPHHRWGLSKRDHAIPWMKKWGLIPWLFMWFPFASYSMIIKQK